MLDMLQKWHISNVCEVKLIVDLLYEGGIANTEVYYIKYSRIWRSYCRKKNNQSGNKKRDRKDFVGYSIWKNFEIG